MKITKSQLEQIIKEELNELGEDPEALARFRKEFPPMEEPREQGPPPGTPCYLVYADYKGYDQYVRYATAEKADVINFMRWLNETMGSFDRSTDFGVVEISGDQMEGGYEKDITGEVLGVLPHAGTTRVVRGRTVHAKGGRVEDS